MPSKKSGSKAKSGGAKAGRRTAKKAGMKDLDVKRGQMIRGGKWLDKTSPMLIDH